MSYHRESWMMEKDEKLQTVPLLHMQGNALVKQRQFREAASRYKEAVLLLKTVQSRVSGGGGGGGVAGRFWRQSEWKVSDRAGGRPAEFQTDVQKLIWGIFQDYLCANIL